MDLVAFLIIASIGLFAWIRVMLLFKRQSDEDAEISRIIGGGEIDEAPTDDMLTGLKRAYLRNSISSTTYIESITSLEILWYEIMDRQTRCRRTATEWALCRNRVLDDAEANGTYFTRRTQMLLRYVDTRGRWERPKSPKYEQALRSRKWLQM